MKSFLAWFGLSLAGFSVYFGGGNATSASTVAPRFRIGVERRIGRPRPPTSPGAQHRREPRLQTLELPASIN